MQTTNSAALFGLTSHGALADIGEIGGRRPGPTKAAVEGRFHFYLSAVVPAPDLTVPGRIKMPVDSPWWMSTSPLLKGNLSVGHWDFYLKAGSIASTIGNQPLSWHDGQSIPGKVVGGGASVNITSRIDFHLEVMRFDAERVNQFAAPSKPWGAFMGDETRARAAITFRLN